MPATKKESIASGWYRNGLRVNPVFGERCPRSRILDLNAPTDNQTLAGDLRRQPYRDEGIKGGGVADVVVIHAGLFGTNRKLGTVKQGGLNIRIERDGTPWPHRRREDEEKVAADASTVDGLEEVRCSTPDHADRLIKAPLGAGLVKRTGRQPCVDHIAPSGTKPHPIGVPLGERFVNQHRDITT